MGAPRTTWRYMGRALSWGIAACALALVVWVIPVRDQCWDAATPRSTRVATTREPAGCTLHLQSGDVRISAEECTHLKCEPGLAGVLAHARPPLLGAILALYVASSLAWAARWRALLGFAGIDLPLAHLWRVSVEAQAGGILLPGGLGGDALRIASVMGRPVRKDEPRAPPSIVVASVLLDRALGLSVIAGLAASLGFLFGGLGAGPLAIMLAGIPFAFLIALAFLRSPGSTERRWFPRRLDGMLAPVLAYIRDPRAPRAMAVAALWGLVVAAIQLGVIRGLVLALGGAPLAEKWVYVGTAMALIVSAIPALPGGWGTADAAYVFFFGLAGLQPGLALAVCLLYRLFWYLLGVTGAILQLIGPSSAPGQTVSPTNTT